MRNLIFKKVSYGLMAGALALALGCNKSAAPGETADEGAAQEAPEAGGAAATAGSPSKGSPAASASKSEAAPPKMQAVTLDAGTPIKIRTTTALSTKSATSGESFMATLAEPIVDGNWVIAPKGATVHGVVSESDPGGRVKGVASLAIRLTKLETSDGEMIDLSTSTFATQAKETKKKDAVKVGIASGVGAAIGAIAGGGKGAAIGAGVGEGAGTGAVVATHGDPAVIPSESLVNFTLREPVTIVKKS
jgi:hypothetical protein